jgi:hypothetical protein
MSSTLNKTGRVIERIRARREPNSPRWHLTRRRRYKPNRPSVANRYRMIGRRNAAPSEVVPC